MTRVLVVDDETGIRGLMARWVESMGWAPTEAGTADQAIDALARAPCDVAVCDVNLPVRDGLWLARQIRQDFPETAVVLATGIQDIESAVGGLRAGIVDYLLKPFGRERFREALERAQLWHRTAAEASRWRRSTELELEARLEQLTAAIGRLDLTSDAAVRGAVGLLTVRDRPAYDHVLRVAALAIEVAADIGLSPSDAADLERAALVHEVARIVVPETVLWRSGELSGDEWAILSREPVLGYELFRGIPFLSAAATILRSLRERHDGAGFPQGLAGDAIPVGSRILAVTDAYDTMVRPMGHREPFMPSEAAAEITAGRGSQFDPVVADALLERLGHALTPEDR